ncbi:ino eighty subunit 6, partial [Cladochytrium replicatum]
INLAQVHKPFKNPRFTPSAKKLKNLKQISLAERANAEALRWSIEAPPSVLPSKRYCDITGLVAPYVDPKSGLRYHNADIYRFIKLLPAHSVQSYLGLRNAAVNLK